MTHEVRWDPGYGTASAVPLQPPKAAPDSRRVGGRVVMVLLTACSGVAVFDVWLMFAGLT